MKIKNRNIGENYPCFIVAEAGLNHNGDIRIAKKMIDICKQCSVDAIKFQTFKAEDFCNPKEEYTYVVDGKEITENQLNMFSRCEFSKEDFKELKDYCEEKDIIFFSAPQNISDLDMLMKLGVPAIKVGSDDLTNLDLLAYYSKKGLPMIISTGMAYISEIDEAVRTVLNYNKELAILHCISSYPTRNEEVNLNKIKTLKKQYPDQIIGFSDHSEGIYASMGAVALGAKIIEKHFTLDKKMMGPDHRFSADPKELKELVDGVRFIEKALGTSQVGPAESEIAMRDIAHRSIVAAKDINKGEIFSEENLTMKRPGTGLPSKYLKYLIGKKSNMLIKQNELITFEKVG